MASKFDLLVEQIGADYLARTADSTTVFLAGQLKRAKNDQLTRVVFVRDGGDIGPSKYTSSLEQSPIVARLERVVANIYAADDERAEQILEELIRSYDVVLGNAWDERTGEYEWVTQTDAGGRHEARGALIRLMTNWRLTVSETVWTLVQIEGQTHTDSLGLGAFSPGFNRGFRYAGGHEAAH